MRYFVMNVLAISYVSHQKTDTVRNGYTCGRRATPNGHKETTENN